MEDFKVLNEDHRLRLILVRHGESVANANHILQGQTQGELTEAGKRQADLLGRYLRTFQIERMISSDLNRVRQTVERILNEIPVPVNYSATVREWNIGSLEGKPALALETALRESGGSWTNFKPAGGETLLQVFERANNWVKTLVDGAGGETILVASHGDFLRMVLGTMRGESIPSALRQSLDNTSFTIADLDGQGTWFIRTLNNTEHLK